MVFVLCIISAMPSYLFAQYSFDEKDAQDRARQQIKSGEPVTPAGTLPKITGEVMSINTKKKKITVGDSSRWNALQPFIIDDETTFTGVKSLGDLGAGDIVSVTYLAYDGSDKTADDIVLKERAGNEKVPDEEAPPEGTLEKVLGGR
jgi:hypothetical protein